MSDDEDMLLAYLRDRDAACPLCGYNLRGLTTPRCPECGRKLKLTVGMAEPYTSAWVALLVALGASGGIGLVIVLSLYKDGWPQWQHPGLAWLLNSAFAYHIAAVPLAIAAVIWRRFLMRRGWRSQWILFFIVAAIGVTMILLVSLFD